MMQSRRRKTYAEEHPFELNDSSHQGNDSISLVSDVSGPGCHTFIAEVSAAELFTS